MGWINQSTAGLGPVREPAIQPPSPLRTFAEDEVRDVHLVVVRHGCCSVLGCLLAWLLWMMVWMMVWSCVCVCVCRRLELLQ